MGRGTVEGLGVAHPLRLQLPSLLQEDAIASSLCDGLDDVLAPIVTALDCLEAYVDPALAPPDALGWLAGWVGLELDETWSPERRRAAIADAATAGARRGTVDGLTAALRAVTGTMPEIEEDGGVVASPVPGAPLPGTGDGRVLVRLRVDDPARWSVARLAALVREWTPAWVVPEVELLGPEG